jgi:hypothetical protein
MENKIDIKELNKLLDSVLNLMDGREASLACIVLGRAIGVLWGYISVNGVPDEGLDELFRIIKEESLQAKTKFKPGKLGFMLNQ